MFEGFETFERETFGNLVGPWRLQSHGCIVGLSALLREHNELGTAMVRIGLEGDQLLVVKIVDDTLHILAVGTEISCYPCDGLGVRRTDDGSKYLPTGAGQTEGSHQAITSGQKEVVDAEDVQREI